MFKTTVVYTAFGPVHLHKQAVFSIITLWYHVGKEHNPPDIVVYTDYAEIFKKYLKGIPVIYEVLTPSTFTAFQGQKRFPFRVKVCVVQEFFKKYKANILFVDTDTFFVGSPEKLIQQISSDTTVFHEYEYTAEEGNHHEGRVWLQFRKLVKNNEFIIQGKRSKFELSSEMWNSGVLGIHYSNQSLLADVLDITDQITAVERLKTGEQFAFSYVFQKNTRIIPSYDIVFHYWLTQKKELFNFHIGNFLRKYNTVPLKTKLDHAMELVEQRHKLTLPTKTLWQRLCFRGSLILQVAKTGHL